MDTHLKQIVKNYLTQYVEQFVDFRAYVENPADDDHDICEWTMKGYKINNKWNGTVEFEADVNNTPLMYDPFKKYVSFFAGKRHGQEKWFKAPSETTTLPYHTVSWKNGKLHGYEIIGGVGFSARHTRFYVDGKQQGIERLRLGSYRFHEISWEDDEKHGIEIEGIYCPQKPIQIFQMSIWRHGKQHGDSLFWDEHGNKTQHVVYNDGEMISNTLFYIPHP